MYDGINRKIENISNIDQYIYVEEYNEIFYFTVYANFKMFDNTEINNIKISTINFHKPRTQAAISKNFYNKFSIEYTIIIEIDGYDKLPTSDIKLPQSDPYLYASQILEILNNTTQHNYKKEIKDHIEKEKNVKLTNIDKIDTIRKAEYNEELKEWEFWKDKDGNYYDYPLNELVYDPLFYVKVTAKDYAYGEYYVLIENTKGLPNKNKIIID